MELLKKLPEILKESKKEYEECIAGNYRAVSYDEYSSMRPASDEDTPAAELQLGMDLESLKEEPGEPGRDAPDHQGKLKANILAKGDNLEFMKFLLEPETAAETRLRGKIDLIYMDPPFFSNSRYAANMKKSDGSFQSVDAFSDRWNNSLEDYLKMLCVRIWAMKDLLSEEGSIWVHMDWHASHYVKVMMDEIFGYNNFVNEVIWHYKSGGSTKKRFARKHDSLLFYAKSSKYYFLPQKEKSYNRGFKPYHFAGVEEFEDEMGWYTMVNMRDVWNIDMVGRTSGERTGYATQKPEALMERIILSCTREGDICADFFGGSGSLAAAAEKSGRRWIYCDNGQLAVDVCIDRLSKEKSRFDIYI